MVRPYDAAVAMLLSVLKADECWLAVLYFESTIAAFKQVLNVDRGGFEPPTS